MTHGASIRSERNAARKVSVRQRPCGTLATSLWPRAQRPCVRVMLVLAQVSSMKTRREGSSRPWYFFHCARRLLGRLSEKPDITLRALAAELAERGIKVSYF